MDDLILRCNALKCREQLFDRAVVTTCSHIFCEPCAHVLGLPNGHPGGQRQCPACMAQLNNQDDAVLAQLNPSEDYKTSVLSGLNPAAIMECAARALAFWSYQATQEVKYQAYLGQGLTDRYQALSEQTDRIVNDANNEIKKLQDRLKVTNDEQGQLIRVNNELQTAYKEKNKSYVELRRLYNAVKAKEMAVDVQHAAEEDADNTLLTAAANRYAEQPATGTRRPEYSSASRLPVFGRNVQQTPVIQRSGVSGDVSELAARFVPSLRSFNQAGQTPMQPPTMHRTRLPMPQHAGLTVASPLGRPPLKPRSINAQYNIANPQLTPKLGGLGTRHTPSPARVNLINRTAFR